MKKLLFISLIFLLSCGNDISYDETKIKEVSIGEWKYKSKTYKYKFLIIDSKSGGDTWFYTNESYVVGCEGRTLRDCKQPNRNYIPPAPVNNNEININIDNQ